MPFDNAIYRTRRLSWGEGRSVSRDIAAAADQTLRGLGDSIPKVFGFTDPHPGAAPSARVGRRPGPIAGGETLGEEAPGMAEAPGQTSLTARWLPDTAPPTGVRAARQRWAAALRRAITLLMESDAPEAELVAAAAALDAFNQRLDALPHRHRLFGYAETATAGRPDALFESSPVTGAANPLAPPLVLRQEGAAVRGTAVFGSAYEGPPGHVHGGYIAAAFDELLGMAQTLSGQRGMTGTLTVRYRRPTPLGRPLDFAAQLDRVEGRKIFVSGTLQAADVLCAEAEGVFVAVDFTRLEQLAREQP